MLKARHLVDTVCLEQIRIADIEVHRSGGHPVFVAEFLEGQGIGVAWPVAWGKLCAAQLLRILCDCGVRKLMHDAVMVVGWELPGLLQQ